MNFAQTRSRRSSKTRRATTGNVEDPTEERRPVCIDLIEDSNSENSQPPAIVDLTDDHHEEEISFVESRSGVHDTPVVCIGPIRRERRRRIQVAPVPTGPETARLRSRAHQSSSRQQEADLNTSSGDVEGLPTFDIGTHTSSQPVPNQATSTSVQEKKPLACPICLDETEQIQADSQRQLVSTVCGHVFCSVCILDAINSEHKCPMCRKKLTKKQFHPIYL